MNPESSSLLLLGVGGAGAAAVMRVRQAYGDTLRAHICDTSAAAGGESAIPFTLLGGDRLAGRGAGGDPAVAREAFRDNPAVLDTVANGVRVCVVACSLGGGTADGATPEILKRLHGLGVTTLVFATMPFSFEGPDRMRAAKAARSAIEADADVAVFLPFDDLVRDAPSDNVPEALARAYDTLAASLAFLWRLLEKPGYIRLDAEHLRAALRDAGRARFAVASAAGSDRAQTALEQICSSRLLMQDGGEADGILLGVLAGDDLRLAEIDLIAKGVRGTFGENATFRLGTVNDEATFSGRLSVVLLLTSRAGLKPDATRRTATSEAALGLSPIGFSTADATLYNGENLDIPTYLRRDLVLDR